MLSLRRYAYALLLTATFACKQDTLEGSGRSPALAGTQQAATVPSGFVDELVVSGITMPTAFAVAPDGRIFVAQLDGQVRVVRDGVLLSEPFATLPVSAEGERGLLGIALDPSFASNAYVYVYYTAAGSTVRNRVSRLRAAGDVAEAGSETTLFELDDVGRCTLHMGGAMAFGPQGDIFVGVGDSCQHSDAQELDNFAGKILRLRADGTIPEDNPFYANASGDYRAIWALGLRNPYTLAISDSGQMFINDVGAGGWEEINEGAPGANYGWPESEGASSSAAHTSPVYAYPHDGEWPTGCAIVGAAFYEPRNPQFPSSYEGTYFFGDFCQGYVRTLDPETYESQAFLGKISALVGLAVGADGSLYRLEHDPGAVVRVRFAEEQAPVITAQPSDRTAAVGQSVTFTVSASGSQPLSYQWQRDGADIAGATAPSYTFTAAMGDDGSVFRAVVTNELGSATSRGATLTVTENAAPVVTIEQPPAGTRYSGGDEIMYAATASDEEDGTLPASAFTWEVELHHADHTHPFIAPFSGETSGSFVIPRIGHTETNVFYRIHVRVRDSQGLESETYRDIEPRLSDIILQSRPSGLSVTLDGTPMVTPASVTSVVGVTRTLGVVSPQTAGDTRYTFRRWSHGEPATHDIDTPATDTEYVAIFGQGCDEQALTPVAAVSSSNEASRLSAGNAIDGDLSTRWSSEFSDPQWIYVDLGSSSHISRVVLHWEAAYARNYELQVSDDPEGGSWETVASRTGFEGGTDTLSGLAATGRYVRVYATERGTSWGNSLWEIELFGNPDPSCGESVPSCGNGVVEAEEECDDGNTIAGDGCSASCTRESDPCVQEALPRTDAVASSRQDSRFPASAAIDGDSATRWSSAFSDPQWIYVDLGASRHISRVELAWETAYAEDYRIEVSNNLDDLWRAVATRTGYSGGTDSVEGLSADARYVRMYSTARGTSWGNSLWELRVFGDPDAGCRESGN